MPPWWHQAITDTSVNYSSLVTSYDIHIEQFNSIFKD